jgi:hypothetical protein
MLTPSVQQPIAIEPLSRDPAPQQGDGNRLEHAGADTAFDERPIAALEHDAIYARRVQQMGEETFPPAPPRQ